METAKELTRFVTRATEAAWVAHVDGMGSREVEDACRGRQPGDLPDSPRDERHRTFEVTIELTADELAAFKAGKEKVAKEAGESISEGEAVARMATAYVTERPAVDGAARTVQSQLTMEQCPECTRAWDIMTGKKIELDRKAIARRICDPKIVGGAHVGANSVAIPRALRRAVLARDGRRCTVPGCRNHGWLELHHTDPLSEGGIHSMETLTTLCWAHHYAHHQGLLIIKGRAGLDLRFEHVDNTPSWIKRTLGLIDLAS